MGNFSLGLTLMVVGMVTVFAILLIVIYLSKLLIVVINKYIPETPTVELSRGSSAAVSATTQRIIAATVSKLTGGKGMVRTIERI